MAIYLSVGQQARIVAENVFAGGAWSQQIGLSAGEGKRTYTFVMAIPTVASVGVDPQSPSNAAAQVVKALAPGTSMLTVTDDAGRIGAEAIVVIPVVAGGVRDQRPLVRVSKIESAATPA